MRMNTPPARMIAAAALIAVTLSACGSSEKASETPVTVFNLSADPGQNLPPSGKHVVLTVAQVRSTLYSLLAQHAKLVATLMHEVAAGDDTPTVAINALTANTQSLTDAIATIYGDDAARAFAQLWEQHTQFFIDYARAARTHDGGAKEEAESKLVDYQHDFASFVVTATAGGASLVAVTNLLHTHVEDMIDYINADVAGHTAEAQQLLEQAIAHMRTIAEAVTEAIAAQHLKTVKP